MVGLLAAGSSVRREFEGNEVIYCFSTLPGAPSKRNHLKQCRICEDSLKSTLIAAATCEHIFFPFYTVSPGIPHRITGTDISVC